MESLRDTNPSAGVLGGALCSARATAFLLPSVMPYSMVVSALFGLGFLVSLHACYRIGLGVGTSFIQRLSVRVAEARRRYFSCLNLDLHSSYMRLGAGMVTPWFSGILVLAFLFADSGAGLHPHGLKRNFNYHIHVPCSGMEEG